MEGLRNFGMAAFQGMHEHSNQQPSTSTRLQKSGTPHSQGRIRPASMPMATRPISSKFWSTPQSWNETTK